MTRSLRILLVQGHRNTSGGDPAESALTPIAARAIQRALRAAGHTADMVQNDHDWYPGSLDEVAREVVRRHDARAYDLMLDIHFEGDANNTRGMFAIVPDGDGLLSFTPYRDSDAMAANPLDVQYAEAISAAVSASTGLRLRSGGVVRPGLMSERQTGVGGRGYRLAMFAYTAKVRHNLVRLVLELGNIRGDAEIITAPGFHERVAAGVVAGIERVLASTPTLVHPDALATVPPFGHMVQLREPVLVTVNVRGLNARKWAETNQPIMRVLHAGNSFWARGWISGERVEGNPIWWVMGKNAKTDLQWRVWSGGTDYSVEAILALPPKEAA